jgi:dTMP kinase
MPKASYIVLEGPDGGGSSTHAKLLCETLRNKGFDIVQTAEPTTGPIGTTIRAELRGKGIPGDALQMLYSADRAWHMAKVVRPGLESGKVVVGERCHLSTLVYGEALGLDVPWLEAMNAKFVEPDLMLVLMPPFEVCAARLGIRDRDMLEADSIQRKVHDAYGRYMRSHPGAVLVDTSGDIAPVAAEIAAIVDRFLAAR